MALGLSLLPLARAFVGAPGAGLQAAALASRRGDVRLGVRGGVRAGRVGCKGLEIGVLWCYP